MKDILNLVNWDYISDGICSNFHGDFNLSNIIYNPKDCSFKFIDWRQDFGGMLGCGDRYYDLAKLYQCFLLPHNSIKNI
jgi:aminoglycoside phosphotransferase (APT) family kinase protein